MNIGQVLTRGCAAITLLSGCVALRADDPPLTREYIRLGGRVIAIEPGTSSGPTALSVSCGTTALGPAEHRVCSVAGYSPAQITWQAPANGSVNSQGEYIAPASIPSSQTVLVGATITADPSKSGSAGIGLNPTFSATQSVFNSNGGAGSIQITRNSPWQISAPSWITLISGASGSQPGTLVFSVTPNVDSAQRTGSLVLDSANSVTVIQYGANQPSCTVTLPEVSRTVAGGAQSGLTVAVTSSCDWVASASVPWITIVSSTGHLSGVVTFNVAANTGGGSRSGEINIGTQTLTITQGLSDFYELDPAYAALYMGGTRAFTLYKTSGGVRTPVTSGITWSATAGSFTDNVYQAPYSGTASPTVTIQASYAGGGVTATVSLYIGNPLSNSGLSVLPTSGAGSSQQFLALYNNPTHWSGDFWFQPPSPTPWIPNCRVKMTPDAGTSLYLRLYSDDGTSFAGSAILPMKNTYNWSAPLTNGQCAVDAMNGYWEAFSQTGPVQYTLPIQFKPPFAGSKSIMMTPAFADFGYKFGDWLVRFGTPPSVSIDAPAAGATVTGDVTITGWALDAETAIQRLQVAVDGVVLAASYYGNARPDVCNVYPGRTGCPNVGYRAAWDSATVANGTHVIRVTAYDSDGPANSSAVERIVTVNNPPGAALKFTPGCAVASSGYCTTSQPVGGWAVTQGSVDLISAVLWPAWVPSGVVLDLTGSANGTLSRQVATTPGTQYTLQFSYTYNPDGGTAGGIRQGSVRVNGATLLALGPFDGSEGSVPVWRNAAIPFTASTAATTIEFVGSSNNSSYGIVLADNITLVSAALPVRPTDLHLTSTAVSSGTQTFEASNSITADTGYSINGSASILFRAGSYIRLAPEFRATAGTASTTLRIYVDPAIQ